MAHPHALINPAMLRWARGRVGLDVSEAAIAVGVKPEQFQRWEEGDSQPTFRQAQQVANALHAPFGYFFLNEAPATLNTMKTIGTQSIFEIFLAISWHYRG